jgi:uncharacterized protein (DUF2147 family)
MTIRHPFQHFANGNPMRASCAAIAGLLLLATPTVLAAQPAVSPLGLWLVAKRYAKINIVNCGEKLWGFVVWESRVGGIDRNNADPDKRSRPTVGMPILLGMQQTEQNLWEGEIYNGEDGKTYSSKISLLDRNTLKIQGCVLGFLCGGENWSRVKVDNRAPKLADSPKTAAASNGAQKPRDARTGKASMAKGSAKETDATSRSDVELCSTLPGGSRPSH